MGLLLDSFWRAALYCFHARVIFLSFLPLFLLILLGGSIGYFYWSDAVESVRLTLEGFGVFNTVLDWLTRFGWQNFRAAVAPMIVIALATPVCIVLVMLVVAWLMTPLLIGFVAQRRFSTLTRRASGSLMWLRALVWTLGSVLLAGALLLISMPLWVIPPLVMIVPPLIVGWLTYRLMSFDALATHASMDECKAVMKEHRGNLLLMGIVTGYLGVMPSLIWTLGTMVAVLAVFLLPLMLWLYTFVFAFSSLWFIHYCLAALEQHRAAQTPPPEQPVLEPVPQTPAHPAPMPYV